MFNPLDKIYPTLDAFCTKFSELTYSKKENTSNIKTKYAINRLNCFYSDKEVFEVDGSIEHLCSESQDGLTLNIGNLILLEQSINNDAGEKDYKEKKKTDYKKSQYKWIQTFCEENPDWNESEIEDRASMMAETFYNKVLGRE